MVDTWGFETSTVHHLCDELKFMGISKQFIVDYQLTMQTITYWAFCEHTLNAMPRNRTNIWCNHWGYGMDHVYHQVTCLVRWPMKQPLKPLLLSIFHLVKFTALFCSSLSQWMFLGEIAISTSRCISMIAVTFCIFDLSPSLSQSVRRCRLIHLSASMPINHWNLTSFFFLRNSSCLEPCTFLPRLPIYLLCRF